jgi:hypothetical protein
MCVPIGIWNALGDVKMNNANHMSKAAKQQQEAKHLEIDA